MKQPSLHASFRFPWTRLLLLCAGTLLAIGLWRQPRSFAGSTPAVGAVTDQLITQQGSGVLTQYGDYIAAGAGLDQPYQYYIEVPTGTSCLFVDIFDADIGTNDLYPYVTSGCNADVNDFDFDASGGNPFGSLDLRSRLELAAPGSGFTHTNPTMSANDTWQSVPFSGWTSADTVEDYGIWEQRVNVADYGPGNYGIVYLRAFDADAGEPPPTSQPETNTFRYYLPTDAGAVPAKTLRCPLRALGFRCQSADGG